MSGEVSDGTPSRSPRPGTVAVVTMNRRAANVALFDGVFWRSCDTFGPIFCAPSAITSIETPFIYDPRTPPTQPTTQARTPAGSTEEATS